MHSVTNLKPYESINSNLDSNSPFDILIENQLINNYVEQHTEKIKLLYKKLNGNIQKQKERIITNKNRNTEQFMLQDRFWQSQEHFTRRTVNTSRFTAHRV